VLFDFASGKSSPERGGEENQDSIEFQAACYHQDAKEKFCVIMQIGITFGWANFSEPRTNVKETG